LFRLFGGFWFSRIRRAPAQYVTYLYLRLILCSKSLKQKLVTLISTSAGLEAVWYLWCLPTAYICSPRAYSKDYIKTPIFMVTSIESKSFWLHRHAHPRAQASGHTESVRQLCIVFPNNWTYDYLGSRVFFSKLPG